MVTFADYKVRNLLKACCAEKQKGHSAFEIFRYLLCLVFCDRSMYMQIMTGRYSEAFGKNTVYRFLNSVRTNWERLTCLLSARIINGSIRELTGDDRQDVFIIESFTSSAGKGVLRILITAECNENDYRHVKHKLNHAIAVLFDEHNIPIM